MEVRLLGKETDAKEVCAKALLPMEVRPSGKETECREWQP